jgi:hypothetical protein
MRGIMVRVPLDVDQKAEPDFRFYLHHDRYTIYPDMAAYAYVWQCPIAYGVHLRECGHEGTHESTLMSMGVLCMKCEGSGLLYKLHQYFEDEMYLCDQCQGGGIDIQSRIVFDHLIECGILDKRYAVKERELRKN